MRRTRERQPVKLASERVSEHVIRPSGGRLSALRAGSGVLARTLPRRPDAHSRGSSRATAGARTLYLAITALPTIVLCYELHPGRDRPEEHPARFTFNEFVTVLVIGNAA